jgi:hypothetical protein
LRRCSWGIEPGQLRLTGVVFGDRYGRTIGNHEIFVGCLNSPAAAHSSVFRRLETLARTLSRLSIRNSSRRPPPSIKSNPILPRRHSGGNPATLLTCAGDEVQELESPSNSLTSSPASSALVLLDSDSPIPPDLNRLVCSHAQCVCAARLPRLILPCLLLSPLIPHPPSLRLSSSLSSRLPVVIFSALPHSFPLSYGLI